MKLRLLLLLLISFSSILYGQNQDNTSDASEDASALLRRTAEELRELEEQITREEDRLARIMSELVQLRRQHAILSSAESAFLLGEELYMSGSIVWARDAFESVKDNFPESIYFDDAIFRLELISFELQDFESALEYFEILRQSDHSFEFMDLAIIAAGLSTYNQGNFPGSRTLYNQVMPSSEYGALAEYLKAVAFVEEGNIESAVASLEGILNRSGGTSGELDLADRARIALAQILVEESRYDEAISYYSKVSPYSSYYDIAMLGYVWTLMRQGEYQDAYNLAERVQGEVPNSEIISEFKLAQANCALGAEDLDIAISMYEDLLSQYQGSEDYYDLFLSGSTLAHEEFELERERLDRIRLGLAELKEEAFTQGDMDLVELIEEEEAFLRELFTEIGYLETVLSLPVEIDPESMEHELARLIQQCRTSTAVLALTAGEVEVLTESHGSERDRQDLADVEKEIERIRLSLQDLASKFEGGMTAEHDWVQETKYGIAVATFMERELKRDSVNYLGAYYRNRIQEALEEGDSLTASSLDNLRSREISSLNRRIDESAIECSGFFEEYLANYPDSRFISDVLVRLAQLYYDIDNLHHSERQAIAGIEEYVPEDYSRSIALYHQVLNEHSGSEVEDIALYSLGYCMESMMDFEGAMDNYRNLLEQYPQSMLAPECNIRVGNFYFDILEYDSALVYYRNVLNYPGSSPNLFQHGLYKLGWTLYLTKNFRNSIGTFAYLLQDDRTIDNLGIQRRGDIRILNETREYLAYDFLEMPDRSASAVATAMMFLNSFDDSVTTVEVLNHMAIISQEMTDWQTSIEAYKAILDENPLCVDAPLYQVKIAHAYEELGEFALAASARDELIANYGADSEWYNWMGEESAIAIADSLRGSSFEDAIQYYLEQTVVSKDDPVVLSQVHEALIERIEAYLQQYSASSKAYEFRFHLGDAYYHTGQYVNAGDMYYLVSLDSSSFQRQEDAFNNAFSSYLIAYDETPGIDSLTLRQKMLETVTKYSETFPNGENVAWFLWAAAPKFYNAGDYDSAREMFSQLYYNYPNSGYAARAAKFIADSYQHEELYAEAEEWYGNASQMAAQSGEDLGADIELLAASSAYQDAAGLAESENTEDLLAAALRWEQAAHEHAGSDVAPVALYDAAETYGKAGSIDNSVRLFQELALVYPSYENAPSGLLRAAYLLREDEQYVRAAQIYLEAYDKFPTAPDMMAALSSAARCYEDGDRIDLAIGVYEQIATDRVGTIDVVIEAFAKIGEYNYNMGNLTTSLSYFESCMSIYDQYHDGQLTYPALSAYHLGEVASRDYYALTPVTTDNLEYKTQLFNGTVVSYNRTFLYLDDDYVFRAVLKIGELQEDFANSIGFMNPSEELTPEGEEAYYNVLMEAYDLYIQRAIDTYENGLELAMNNGIRTEWTDFIAVNLDLLLPGSSSSMGYSSFTPRVEETPETEEIIDVEDGFTSDSTDTETSAADTTVLEESDASFDEPGYTIRYEEEESGGGCFLWPF